jgi:hypothetical protein
MCRSQYCEKSFDGVLPIPTRIDQVTPPCAGSPGPNTTGSPSPTTHPFNQVLERMHTFDIGCLPWQHAMGRCYSHKEMLNVQISSC